MLYVKPICKCGGPLKYIEEYVIHIGWYITDTGVPGKRQFTESIKRNLTGFTGVKWLKCDKCGREYAVEYDDKERLVRGEQIKT